MPTSTTTATRKSARTSNGRRARGIRIKIGAEITRHRLDAGLSIRRLAALAEIDDSFLSLIERGLREPSIAVLAAIAEALGGNLSVRIYPGTGPRTRDPIQASMVEALLRVLHPRWVRRLEIPVYRPVRGVIDAVIHEPMPRVVIATEVQSELRRIEQLLRWSHEKADALPSASMWEAVTGTDRPAIDRLLIIRSTSANRRIVREVTETLRTEFPGDPSVAYRALTSPDVPWPGSSLLWAAVDGEGARILDRPPRGVSLGFVA